MATSDEHAPHDFPVDAEEEKQRLLADAREAGVDEGEALRLAEQVARTTTPADAYRTVDRRIASGYSLDDARKILLGDGEPDETR